VSRDEPNIDINFFSIENPCERLFKKEKKEEETRKEEKSFMPLSNIMDKEYSKRDCHILNSSFHSYSDANSSF